MNVFSEIFIPLFHWLDWYFHLTFGFPIGGSGLLLSRTNCAHTLGLHDKQLEWEIHTTCCDSWMITLARPMPLTCLFSTAGPQNITNVPPV